MSIPSLCSRAKPRASTSLIGGSAAPNTKVHRLLAGALCLSAVACGAPAVDQEAPAIVGQSQALYQPQPTVPRPANPYSLFETLQVRPLALSANGRRLYALNTPDNRLEIFRINPSNGSLQPWKSVTVGLEPIALALHGDNEVWVVNHLSDSVSIVRVDDCDDDDEGDQSGGAGVVRTLLVGDEPRDIVFAGPERNLAFITTAHRGQNMGEDPKLFDPTVGRADVWIFDANNLGSALTGTRLSKLTLFADTPRALAVSADGTRVYAAPFFSGNETTLASKEAVATAYASAVDPTNPNFVFFLGTRQPLTSRVVKRKLGPDGLFHWFDDLGTNFDAAVKVSLPDYDVFTIDATQSPPAAIPAQTFAHVGTTLFNMAVHPNNGKVYVSNTEAHNDVRFEGHNPTLGVTSVRGNIVDSRISVLDPSSGALVHNNLNGHIVNGQGDASLSRAFPQDLVFTADGSKLLVVAQGSAKLAIYDTAALESGSAAPSAFNQVLLSAGGPTGVVLDKKNRAYVLTRFDNGISLVNLATRTETKHLRMFSPEPTKVTAGRRFLYDAAFTSENGTQACASCHIGGDMDHLSWDLGNPGGIELPITRNGADSVLFTAPPALISQLAPTAADLFTSFRPVKGPMTTQSLRGLDNHGPMHWRGDRNGAVQQDGTPFLDDAGAPIVSAQPNAGMFDEFAAFFSFNVAFPGLVGRQTQLSSDDMAAFTRFALELMYPPNPNRALDDTLTPAQATGRAFYFQTRTLPDGSSAELPVDRLHNCNGCHTLDPAGNAGQVDRPGFFGSSGRLSFENLTQIFKVAHLRNAYQKLGMFASSPDSNRTLTVIPQLNPALPAVRGFGYQPDGAVGQIPHHLSGRVFIKTTNPNSPVGQNPGGIPTFVLDANGDPVQQIDPAGIALRQALASFVLAYDSNFKPALGQQVSFSAASGSDVVDRIALLTARAQAGDCALVAKTFLNGRERGYVLEGSAYRPDKSSEASLSEADLKTRVLNANSTLTFSCVPSNAGYRIGIDRDADGIADGDER